MRIRTWSWRLTCEVRTNAPGLLGPISGSKGTVESLTLRPRRVSLGALARQTMLVREAAVPAMIADQN
jgi:hypothetical protein